eukprot:CAMPEP_0201488602 /NCGR_PEP_ID=MMETSP0151_2-20130828/19268_1 /ASSEMBLY_ACC=CAM_ASM_000257 /TAXON_ID=200890 /ORGANISM="Paramoeba atlantica, Strain 621/1 / CCAP 1560/9" /LENGTH=168 /DNA_ID=CAMNT_0047873927 /DNA_START=87 /DNA_END=593 /DNA_ORIENTATION=-
MSQWGRITLFDAASQGDVELVKKRLTMELAKINGQDAQGKTPLHEACRWNHSEVAQLLIDEGANPDLEDKEGATPLHIACRFGQLDAIRVLLKNNAWIDAQTWDGDTPLHSASGSGHPEAVQILLEAGVDTKLKNTKNKTAKDVAANSDTGAVFQSREKTYVSPTNYT